MNKRPGRKIKSVFLGEHVKMGFADFTLEGRVIEIIKELDVYMYKLEMDKKTLFISLMDVCWVELIERKNKMQVVK